MRWRKHISDALSVRTYLWARTVRCEGPGCGIEVPLIRSLWIARKGRRSVALKLRATEDGKVAIEVVHSPSTKEVSESTVKRGSATCPACGFTTPVDSVRRQLKSRHGGAADARLLCVVTSSARDGERGYRTQTEQDRTALIRALESLNKRKNSELGPLKVIPDEKLDVRGIRHTWAMIYGIESWGDLFTPRQALSLSIFAKLVREAAQQPGLAREPELAAAVQTCLAFALDKCADYWSSASTWMPRETVRDTFARQALPLTWDFVEANPIADFHCAWAEAYAWVEAVCRTEATSAKHGGQVERASAVSCPLPTDSVDAFITDPPYYDAVPYAYLSDFFYVWLRRSLPEVHASILREHTVPKDEEIVVDRPHELSDSKKNVDFYERELTRAFGDGRRVSRPGAIGTIVFASKTTASWEAILQAVIEAGWVVTASWPIDTEREARVSAQGQARLGSSVHLVCRPREAPDGSLRDHDIGDWRDTLTELPGRIRDWMPRLASEGIVGADAIFACLGPALEIFSRYSRVEKSNGDIVPLREYLEHVWAAVSNEALSMIFKDADAAGLEPDARLTAMWLWTLNTTSLDANGSGSQDEASDGDAEEDDGGTQAKASGFVLEFDAARKIAQGLGIHLERIPSVVEVKADKARLLPVAERTKYLFGKDSAEPTTAKKKPKKKDTQLSLFAALQEADAAESVEKPELKAPQPGSTVLDRVHQAMILFAAGRGEALKRFLVEEGAGKDARFWKLAQSLSALYPAGIDEKRWVDGVLARKKSLGL
jgi:adenine-specific DNA methylase